MQVTVHVYSYFKELTGSAELVEQMREGQKLGDLLDVLGQRFPKLGAMQKSMLMAVGVDYQKRDYALKEGDQISLFPPVQGG
jgi:molybdopterin converting factor small subunit